MTTKQRILLSFLGIVLACFGLMLHWWNVHAMEFQEVKPYVFAEFPHGRIYKTVHEGCELYIVESDVVHTNDWDAHTYALTTGRGCK